MPDKTITQEITEFRDSITQYDKDNVGASLMRCGRELFDVVGRIVNLDDDEANLNELSDAASDALSDFVAKALADRPFIKRGAQVTLPLIVPALVDEAAKYTGTAEKFIDEKVLPYLAQAEELIHGARVALAG